MALHKKAARTAVFLVGKAGPPMRSFSAHVTFAKRFCGIHIAAESRTARIRNPLLSARYFPSGKKCAQDHVFLRTAKLTSKSQKMTSWPGPRLSKKIKTAVRAVFIIINIEVGAEIRFCRRGLSGESRRFSGLRRWRGARGESGCPACRDLLTQRQYQEPCP